MQNKKKFLSISGLIVISFLFFLVPILTFAQAQMSTTVEDIPRKTSEIKKDVKDKVEKSIWKALTSSAFNALLNVATLMTQRLAYDAAMYITSGGEGGNSLIEFRSWKEYSKMLGEQALGEFVGSLSQDWSSVVGFNICEPSPLQKLEIQKSFLANIPKPKVPGQTPPTPKCDWDSVSSAYKNFAKSLADFSIGIDLDFDVKYEGDEVILDLDSVNKSITALNSQFSKLTERLYGEGIDLPKLWTDTRYLYKFFNIDEDEASKLSKEDRQILQKAMPQLRLEAFRYANGKKNKLEAEFNDLLNKLRKQYNVPLKSYKTFTKEETKKVPATELNKLKSLGILTQETLSYFKEIENLIKNNEIEAAQEKLKKILNKEATLKIWISNGLLDKTFVLAMIANPDNADFIKVVLKYAFAKDIELKITKNNDTLNRFMNYLEPGQNPASVSMELSQKLTEKMAEANLELEKLKNNQGFKDVVDVVSGRIKTPATVVQEQFKQSQIKDPSTAKWSAITGAYFNADVGMSLVNVALSTFTSTVFNNLMDKIYTGIFEPDKVINQNQVTVGLSKLELAKAFNYQEEMIALDYTMTNYNPLDDFAICPEYGATERNCVLDNAFASVLQRSSSYLTVQDALDQGYLHADWPLISKNNPLNGEKDCYRYGYCYKNLQLLRKARIISVGWELAAQLCEDSANSQYCSIDKPVTLGEVVKNFYNCGQDEDHPYSIWCNMIDPNWVLKLPATTCNLYGYGEESTETDPSLRKKVCLDEKTCIHEDVNGNCDAWGYCTREKNIWRFPNADKCESYEDSCRLYKDSQGKEFAFLKNTLLLNDLNVCDENNIGCRWFSKNKEFDALSKTWNWTDRQNGDDYIDRVYFNSKVKRCSADDEGCSHLILASPATSVNLLPNSSFNNYKKITKDLHVFDSWEASNSSVNLYKDEKHYPNAVLVQSNSIGEGLTMKNPLNILAKNSPRSFIYSATLIIPVYQVDLDSLNNDLLTFTDLNIKNKWALDVIAGKTGGILKHDYIYDFTGHVETTDDDLQADTIDDFVEVKLYLRFRTEADVDRLKLSVINTALDNAPAQVYVKNIQLEEVEENTIVPSAYTAYASKGDVFMKLAPDYYNCYQNWAKIISQAECEAKNGQWNGDKSECEAPSYCQKYALACSIDEVGCREYTNTESKEIFTGIVKNDDYCPAECANYQKLYETGNQFENDRYVNLIPETAQTCSISAVGCEEYTAVNDDGSLENKYYFSYVRSCEKLDADDCQIFYTWDNPDSNNNSIKKFVLKAKNGEPYVVKDDSLECNETIYNLGLNPDCYKFYSIQGGETIDLNNLSEAHVSYHLYSNTITCSNECKTYRLTRAVEKDKCLALSDNNRFEKTATKTLDNGDEVDIGLCYVSAILDENNACSPQEVGCREYKGSKSNASLTILTDTFESDLNAEVWAGAKRVKVAVNYNGYAINNLASDGVITAKVDQNLLAQDKMYILSFWAKTSVANSDRLYITMGGTDQDFTDKEGLELTSKWQKYILGPVRLVDDPNNYASIDLVFNGIQKGNLYIDNIELKESLDSYYLIKDSWNTPDSCDTIPGTNITLPGYMLGCQAYTDNYSNIYYLKSFSSSCRESAVGCDLFIDLRNNREAEETIYQHDNAVAIGELYYPLINDKDDCLAKSNTVWVNGHCYYDFDTKPINDKQCKLWGFYWKNDKCWSETSDDDVIVQSDRLLALVYDENKLCKADKVNCKAFGSAKLDADGNVMTCALNETCENELGCACNDENNEYICTVEKGADKCNMDTVYLIDNADNYDNLLCHANAESCDKFTDSYGSTLYFKNPGERLCEYKEVRIDGELKKGWFKKGTNDPCYPDYQPAPYYWGANNSLSYYLVGVDNLANYNFYVGTCSKTANGCTDFIDPVAKLNGGGRHYYYILNDKIDTKSCQGQVNLAEGCVLFNNTDKAQLLYSAEQSYQLNKEMNYKAVAPVMGMENALMNPLTSLLKLDNQTDSSAVNSVVVKNYLPYRTKDGKVQILPFEGQAESSSSLIPSLGGISLIGENSNISTDILDNLNIESLVIDKTFTSTNLSNLPVYSDINKQYQDLVKSSLEEDELSKDNNANVIVKVERDRVCAEWLDKGDSQMVENNNKNQVVNTSLVSCRNFRANSSIGNCAKAESDIVPEYLNADLYRLRGFGLESLDYSGYSIPFMYKLSNYRQIYYEGQNILAIDLYKSCEEDSDCGYSEEFDTYRCIDKHCYNIANGSLTNESDQIVDKCRAYPKADSPREFNAKNKDVDNLNTCYPYKGVCVNTLTNQISYGSECKADYDCLYNEKCVYTESVENSDCLCDYKEIFYKDYGKKLFTSLDDDLENAGICMGGINDGLACNDDSDCANYNRTNFRDPSKYKDRNEGRCIYPNSVKVYKGLHGLCVEKDNNDNCLTWMPIQRSIGESDIYGKTTDLTLPSNYKYYCLKDGTGLSILRSGYRNYMTPDTEYCNTAEDDFIDNTRLQLFWMFKDVYKNGGSCNDDNYRRRYFLNFAIVDVTDELFNNISIDVQKLPDIDLNGFNNDETFYNNALKNLEIQIISEAQKIRKKWQGQSCFYMALDYLLSHPDIVHYYDSEKQIFHPTLDNADVEIHCNDGSEDTVSLFVNNFYPLKPKALSKVIQDIEDAMQGKECYVRFNIAGVGSNSSEHISEDVGDKVVETMAMKTMTFYYLLDNVCVYKNLLLTDEKENNIFTIYNSFIKDKENRYKGVLDSIEIRQPVCLMLAQVQNDNKENYLYLNQVNKYADLDLYFAKFKGENNGQTLSDVQIANIINELGDKYTTKVSKSVCGINDLYKSCYNLKQPLYWLNDVLKNDSLFDQTVYKQIQYGDSAYFGALSNVNTYNLYPSNTIDYFKVDNYQGLDWGYCSLSSLNESSCVANLVPFTNSNIKIVSYNNLFNLYKYIYDVKVWTMPINFYDFDKQKMRNVLFSLHPYSSYQSIKTINIINNVNEIPDFNDEELVKAYLILRNGNINWCIKSKTVIPSCDKNREVINNSNVVLQDFFERVKPGSICKGDYGWGGFTCKFNKKKALDIFYKTYYLDNRLASLDLENGFAIQKNDEKGLLVGKDTIYNDLSFKNVKEVISSEARIQTKHPSLVFKKLDNYHLSSCYLQNLRTLQCNSSYQDRILDNHLYQLAFYAQADKNALPIKDIIIDWGDSYKDYFVDYAFKNHLPVCNVKGPYLGLNYQVDDYARFNNSDENNPVYNPDGVSLELVDMNMDITINGNKHAGQELAGDPKACVESPFIFNHWYKDILVLDENGNYICKYGEPLDDSGNVVSNDSGNVVQCKLTGHIYLKDNLDQVTTEDFNVYVSKYYLLQLGPLNFNATTSGSFNNTQNSYSQYKIQLNLPGLR